MYMCLWIYSCKTCFLRVFIILDISPHIENRQLFLSPSLSLKAERPKTKHQRLTSRKTAERSKEGDKGARKGTKNTGFWTITQLFPCIPNRCIRTVYTAFAMHSVRMQLISLYRICYASINLLRASIMSSWFALFISLFENSNSLSLVTHTLSL